MSSNPFEQDSKSLHNLSALYKIFEKHLYDFHAEEDGSEETEQEFVDKIVNDYIKFLRTNGVSLPARWTRHIHDELRHQVRQMLIKKTYGCLSIREFVSGEKEKKPKSKKRFSNLF
jgi:hypothetical protein